MPITTPDGPDGAPALIGERLARLSRGESFSAEQAPAVFRPIPVYRISLSALTTEENVDLLSLLPQGWRYVVRERGELVLVDVSAPQNADTRVTRVTRGLAGIQVLTTALQAEQVANPVNEYEARIMDLRPAGAVYIWLHGQDDLFFALSDPAVALAAAQVVGPAQEHARRIMAIDLGAGREDLGS